MVENLMRFASWQGLLAAPLAVIGVAGAVRHAGPLRCMVAGLFLTTAMLVVLMPYQGYGWGYRYWHGLIGPLALIAALGWRRLSDGVDRARAQSVFVAAAAVSAFVLVPIRLVQAHDQVAPYARAWRAVASASTPLVIIDPKGGWYLDDLVRNDPHLANRPLVLRAEGLTRGQFGLLCDRYAVSTLDAAGAKTFGIRAGAAQAPGQSASRWRRLGLPPACGPGRAPVVRLAAPDSPLREPGGSRPPR